MTDQSAQLQAVEQALQEQEITVEVYDTGKHE